jgi:hypothetical protein
VEDDGEAIVWEVRGVQRHPRQRGRQAEWLSQGLTFLIQDAAIFPSVSWDQQQRSFRVTLARAGQLAAKAHRTFSYSWPSNNLFSDLVAQPVVAVAGNLYRCDWCGWPFESRRRPRVDKRRYCESCRREADLASKRNSWVRHGREWRPSKKLRPLPMEQRM